MTQKETIKRLRAEIDVKLKGLINNDYVLLDVPYHGNIGDTLIWQGETDFLKTLPFRCLEVSPCDAYRPDFSMPASSVILLNGGGNFGDLWPGYHEFKMRIIEHNQKNRIILFPQSIWYKNKDLIKRDADIISRHPDIHLCARDNVSFEFMCRHFPTADVILVPDMAFYINDGILNQYRMRNSEKELYLKRLDKELSGSSPIALSAKREIRDWPTVENELARFYWINKALCLSYRFSKWPRIADIINRCVSHYASFGVRKHLVRIGGSFISQYKDIVTTRLHAMILSVLLYKPVRYVDNSTGKLSAFADTWLSDCDDVSPYHEIV